MYNKKIIDKLLSCQLIIENAKIFKEELKRANPMLGFMLEQILEGQQAENLDLPLVENNSKNYKGRYYSR